MTECKSNEDKPKLPRQNCEWPPCNRDCCRSRPRTGRKTSRHIVGTPFCKFGTERLSEPIRYYTETHLNKICVRLVPDANDGMNLLDQLLLLVIIKCHVP